MKRLMKGWIYLRRNRRAGVSLIVAICAAALILGLSLSLIYSASLPMARANLLLPQERCYQLAKTFSQVLDRELRAYRTEAAAPADSFYLYANHLLEGIYGEYDPDNPNLTTFYYSASGSAEDDYGKITVALRKQAAQDENDVVSGGTFDPSESDSETRDIESRTFIQYLFYVDVTAQLEEDRYTYTAEYYRRTCFQPRYTYNGSQIFYDADNTKQWYLDHNFQPGNLIEIDENAEISYTYDESVVVSKIFEPTYLTIQEGGGAS